MKKIYNTPEIEFSKFDVEDIITTSGITEQATPLVEVGGFVAEGLDSVEASKINIFA